jgi:hypothetical protein
LSKIKEEGGADMDDGGSMDDQYADDGYGSNEEYNRFVRNYGSQEDQDQTELYDDEILRDDLEYRLDMTDFQDDYVDVDSSDLSDASFSGDSGDTELFLPRAPYIPNQNVFDTKAASGSLRTGGSYMMSDQLGTGDLLDDETSAAGLLALLGLLAVIVVVSFLSASWHRTMDALPLAAKKSSGKQDARKQNSTSPLLKRRDHSQ